jgi:hypothetical protein
MQEMKLMTKIIRIRLVIGFALLFVAPQSVLLAQSARCHLREMHAQLQKANPAYADAMELAQTLSEHGFIIKCVLGSKMDRLFEGMKGAALFRTNRGDFEALFLPKAQTFAEVNVIEQRRDNEYIYSFQGNPKPWPANRMEGPRRTYFLKHANQLLVIDDDQLRARLEEILNSR